MKRRARETELNFRNDCFCEQFDVKCEHKFEAPSDVPASDEAINPNVVEHDQVSVTQIVAHPRSRKQGCAMEIKQAKGLEIATNSEVTREGNVWIVPSQSSSKKYTVNLFIHTCTCPDFEENRHKCKHIHAAEYALKRESGGVLPAPEKVVKPTFPQQWPAYNLAQTNEKSRFQELLHELCRNVEDLPRKPGAGRNRLPFREMIFCAAFKVYSLFSGRRFISDLREAHKRGFISKTPHFNSIFNYLEMEEMTGYLKAMIIEASLPLDGVERAFAVDASGFATCRYVRWLHAKYSQPHLIDKQDWLKVHLACGVKTNVVTAVEVSDGRAGDSPFFKQLIETTAENFVIDEVSADKAYSSSKNLQLVLVKGGQPYIAFRSNANARDRRQSSVWKRMYHFYRLCLKISFRGLIFGQTR